MEYKHFSHEHTLALTRAQPGDNLQCHGCQLICEDSIYACWKCSFFLHEHCGNASRYVKHPSHPQHLLVLVPTPTYCSGSFLCNACGTLGSSSSFCCPLCEVDLHVHCAYLPPRVNHNAHHHELSLFYSTERGTTIGACKICTKEMNPKKWSYVCDVQGCNFQAHTFCATREVKPELYQDDGLNEHIPASSTPPQNVNPPQPQPQPQPQEITPEEFILEVNRLRMEFQMAQALGNIIAYYPN